MHTVLLADNFSFDEPGYFGRAFANRSLLKAIFLCKSIDRVLMIADRNSLEVLELPPALREKLILIRSLEELNNAFKRFDIHAILCSDFTARYPNWIEFRNQKKLRCPVFGFTHSLSYQRFTASLYQILAAGPAEGDAVLCTSSCAMQALKNLFEEVGRTTRFEAAPPALLHFPLAYEAKTLQTPARDATPFRVLYLGRLDWQTKADILALEFLIKNLPPDHAIRFTVAGAVDNEAYKKLLLHYLQPLGVELCFSVSEKEKEELYSRSHIFFSPSDNYQETFGLTILEAKHYGCVPVVTDFDGYRDIIENGKDGFLLRTVAASIPGSLFILQNIVDEKTYHGWWAAGVAFDPRAAAQAIYSLSKDINKWQDMSNAAIQSVSGFSLEAASARFADVIEKQSHLNCCNSGKSNYPFRWNFSELFDKHPGEFWKGQSVTLTTEGERYLQEPHSLPQFMLLSETIKTGDIREFLFLIKRGHDIQECIRRGIEPVVMSLSMKNGLISFG